MNSQESKDSVIGILSSIIIHSLLFAAAYFLIFKKQEHLPRESKKTISLGQFVDEKPQEQAQKNPTPLPPQKQKKQKQEKKELVQKNTLAKTKAPDANRTAKKTNEQATTAKTSLLSALNEKFKDSAKENRGTVSKSTGGMIKKLYGEEFDRLSPEEQKFIQNNLGEIQRIGQRYFTQVSNFRMPSTTGYAIAEFYLHPNGDISDLKLIKKSGYSVQDKNAIETIELAFKDFPRPSVKTKIRWGFTVY
jgi:outer membrane biosynthesis protein TonB